MTLLQIYHWVCQWKNFENRSTFGEVTDKSIVACFFDSQCILFQFIHLTCSANQKNICIHRLTQQTIPVLKYVQAYFTGAVSRLYEHTYDLATNSAIAAAVKVCCRRQPNFAGARWRASRILSELAGKVAEALLMGLCHINIHCAHGCTCSSREMWTFNFKTWMKIWTQVKLKISFEGSLRILSSNLTREIIL